MANLFDQFDAPPGGNVFDQFDAPAAPKRVVPTGEVARRALASAGNAAIGYAQFPMVGAARLIDLAAGLVGAKPDLATRYGDAWVQPNINNIEANALKPGEDAGAVGTPVLAAAPELGKMVGDLMAGGPMGYAPRGLLGPATTAATNAIPAAVNALREGAVVGLPAGFRVAAERNAALQEAGASPLQAAVPAAVSGLSTVGQFALPASMGSTAATLPGRIASRGAQGAAINADAGIVQRQLENAVLPDAAARMRVDPTDPASVIADALGGALFGQMGSKAQTFRAPNREALGYRPDPTTAPGATDFAPAPAEPLPIDLSAATKAVNEALFRAEGGPTPPDVGLVPKGAPTPVSAPDPLRAPTAPDWKLEGDAEPAPPPRPTVADQVAQDDLAAAVRQRIEAEEAFTLANRRQEQADRDLRREGQIDQDYQGDDAAYKAGEPVRNITLLDGEMPVMVNGRTDTGKVDVTWQNPDGTYSRQIVEPGRLTERQAPVNQRMAQDFNARSSEMPEGVGAGTRAQERMPDRSSDRIAGDTSAGRAAPYDPTINEPRAPRGPVEVVPRDQQGGPIVPRDPAPVRGTQFEGNAPRLENRNGPEPATDVTGRPDGNGNRQLGPTQGDAAATGAARADPNVGRAPDQRGAAAADARTATDAGDNRGARVDPKAEKREAGAFIKSLSESQSRNGRGGITPKLMRDIFGNRVGDVRKQFPMLANNKGHGSDDLVQWAKDNGWMSEADIARLDASKPGGAYEHVADMLRDAASGKAPKRPDVRSQEAEYEAMARDREDAQMADDAERLGVDIKGMSRERAQQTLLDAEVRRLDAEDREAFNDAMNDAAEAAREGRTLDDLLDEVGVTDKDIEDAKYRREAEIESKAVADEAERARAGGEGDSAEIQQQPRPAQQARPDEVRPESESRNEPDRAGPGEGDGATGKERPADGEAGGDAAAATGTVKRDEANYRLNALPLDAAWRGLKQALRHLVSDDSASGPLRKAIADALSEAKAGNAREAIAKTLGALVWSDASVVKSVADARNSPTLHKVWRMFSDMGGTEKIHGETFEQEVHARYNRNINEVSELLKDLSPEQVKQVKGLLENRQNIRGNEGAHKAARRIAELLDAERKWLKDSGVEIGDTKNYVPRVYLAREIVAKATEFKAAAERAYRQMGLDATEAKAAAEAWYNATRLKGDGVPEVPFLDLTSGAPQKNFAKTREIPIDVIRKSGLDKFLDQDLFGVLDGYFRRTSKRGAFESRFGGTDEGGANAKWREMRKALDEEKNSDLIGWAENRILSMSGQMKSDVGDGIRATMSLARAVTVATFLRRAVISSLTEPLQVANRTAAQGGGKAVKNALTMYAHGAERLARALTGMGKSASEIDRHRMAMMLGTVLHENVESGVASLRFDGDTLPNERGTSVSRAADRLSFAAMKASGLHDWTTANMVDSTIIGMDFIKAMAEDAAAGKRLANYELDRLGIAEADHAAFGKYVAKLQNSDQLLADLRAGNKQAQQYAAAIDKFTRQVIMKPTAADKPVLAKHPVAQMAYGLQSWMYSYWYNVQKANIAQIKEAATGKGYTAGERATMAGAPVMYTAAVLAMTGGLLTAMRDLYAGRDKDKEREEKNKKSAIMGMPLETLRMLSQAQMFGLADPFVNSMTSARYNKLPGSELGGPLIGRGQRFALDQGALVTDKNSPNTNTAERKAAESAFNLLVDPALAVASASLPMPLAAAATFASQRDEIRQAYINESAGKKQK